MAGLKAQPSAAHETKSPLNRIGARDSRFRRHEQLMGLDPQGERDHLDCDVAWLPNFEKRVIFTGC